MAAYPDVTVIQTHRDPAKTMPSTVSTTALVQWLRTDDIDVDAPAEVIGAVFGGALSSVAAARADGSFPVPVGDVRFTDMIADPADTIGRAYAELDREFTAEHAAAIEAYVRDKPKGRFGHHRYTADDWGFDADALRTEMNDYLDRVGIQIEST